LPRERPRYARYSVNRIGDVAGRKGTANLRSDARLQILVDLDSLGGGHEQEQLAHPDAFVGLVLDVDDEAVGDLGEGLHKRVELRRPEPDAASVQRGVG